MTHSERFGTIEAQLKTRWVGHPTVVLDTVDSTNRWLKERWSSGKIGPGTVVWADEQMAGRGRLGRQWASPAGFHIYTSLLWFPPHERLTGLMSLVAGVAVVRAVRAITHLDARLKWPNDAVIGGKKFAGVLVEAGQEPVPWAIIGIGMNVRGSIGPSFPHATTLEEASGRTIARGNLWLQLMGELEQAYTSWKDNGDQWVVEAWSAINVTLGQEVRIEQPGHAPWTGTADQLDLDGGLWVKIPGRRVKVISGEVSVRLADGRYAPERF